MICNCGLEEKILHRMKIHLERYKTVSSESLRFEHFQYMVELNSLLNNEKSKELMQEQYAFSFNEEKEKMEGEYYRSCPHIKRPYL